jgi:16S rRNA (uracil1498-N3)-methyltransferase
MHRFYLPPEQCLGNILLLSGTEAHHARDVMRIRPRDRVTVLDGAGNEFLCDVQAFAGETVQLTVQEKHSHAPLETQVTLLQAVPKGKTMDAIIQKATELGASRIVPLLTDRVIARFEGQEADRKVAKWRMVAREAIKQCGSAWLPVVELPTTLYDFFRRNEGLELPLIASLQSGSRWARNYFGSFRSKHGRAPASIGICIGPEGDFTSSETELICVHGFLPITLGPLVLRAETAATYCLSVLNYELHSAKSVETTPQEH